MANLELATRLIETLPVGRRLMFNPWRESCPHDRPINTPAAKLARLAEHLDCNARLILIGEAPGYQGCRYSGIAFTSERLLLAGGIPRVTKPTERLTDRHTPWSEPSATVVWRTLRQLGLEERTILWNAVQLHPFKNPKDTKALEHIHTNRTPTDEELALGRDAMRLLIDAFPHAELIAVGQKAERQLKKMGITPAGEVRHPANGGATQFANELAELTR